MESRVGLGSEGLVQPERRSLRASSLGVRSSAPWVVSPGMCDWPGGKVGGKAKDKAFRQAWSSPDSVECSSDRRSQRERRWRGRHWRVEAAGSRQVPDPELVLWVDRQRFNGVRAHGIGVDCRSLPVASTPRKRIQVIALLLAGGQRGPSLGQVHHSEVDSQKWQTVDGNPGMATRSRSTGVVQGVSVGATTFPPKKSS